MAHLISTSSLILHQPQITLDKKTTKISRYFNCRPARAFFVTSGFTTISARPKLGNGANYQDDFQIIR